MARVLAAGVILPSVRAAHPPTLRRQWAGILAVLIAFAALAAFAQPGAAAEAPVAYKEESLAQYNGQLAAGQISEVTINKRLRSLHATLKNGEHVKARYGAKEEAKYEAALRAKGVPVTVLSPTAANAEAKKVPVHHKLRYIAGGILLAVILIVGAVLFVNRRRKAVLD